MREDFSLPFSMAWKSISRRTDTLLLAITGYGETWSPLLVCRILDNDGLTGGSFLEVQIPPST